MALKYRGCPRSMMDFICADDLCRQIDELTTRQAELTNYVHRLRLMRDEPICTTYVVRVPDCFFCPSDLRFTWSPFSFSVFLANMQFLVKIFTILSHPNFIKILIFYSRFVWLRHISLTTVFTSIQQNNTIQTKLFSQSISFIF